MKRRSRQLGVMALVIVALLSGPFSLAESIDQETVVFLKRRAPAVLAAINLQGREGGEDLEDAHFRFIDEEDEEEEREGEEDSGPVYIPAPNDQPVAEFDLATRLSYFLWASTPDEELLNAAASGELSDPEKRQAQVKRMLADPRSLSLGEIFAAEWFSTDDVGPRIRKDPIDNSNFMTRPS
jgi:hypothetical protein